MGSSAPQGGGQMPAGGTPVPSTSAAGSGASNSPTPSSPPTDSVSVIDDSAGDVLQASTTVASIAVALIALFPVIKGLAKTPVVTIGSHWSLSLGTAISVCGIIALASCVSSLDKLRRKAMLSGFSMLFTHIGLLLIVLLLFLLVYLGIAANYAF